MLLGNLCSGKQRLKSQITRGEERDEEGLQLFFFFMESQTACLFILLSLQMNPGAASVRCAAFTLRSFYSVIIFSLFCGASENQGKAKCINFQSKRDLAEAINQFATSPAELHQVAFRALLHSRSISERLKGWSNNQITW